MRAGSFPQEAFYRAANEKSFDASESNRGKTKAPSAKDGADHLDSQVGLGLRALGWLNQHVTA
jgi:hypothetical protein